ncbi:MAG TPA: uroporphyrinogen-III synthase [Myxococcota bacterium]
MVPWVVTREAGDAAPLLSALRERGVDARSIPAIERRPLPWPDVVRGHEDSAMFFLTSPYAARLTLAHLHANALDARVFQFAAIAPATVAVLRAASLQADVHCAGGSIALARAVDGGARGRSEILYPTSDVGLDSPEQNEAAGILARAHSVRRFAIYCTNDAHDLVPAIRALASPYCVVFHSPSAVDAFGRALADGAPPPIFAACVGESTLRAHQKMRVAAACALVPRGVDVADFAFAYPHILTKAPEIA